MAALTSLLPLPGISKEHSHTASSHRQAFEVLQMSYNQQRKTSAILFSSSLLLSSLELSDTKALNTSPPRNRFAFLLSSCDTFPMCPGDPKPAS